MIQHIFRKKAPLLIAALGMMLLFVFGCSKSDSGVTGKWYNVKAPEIVEFKQDGTGSFSYTNNQNPPLTFAWKQTADNNYAIDVTYMGNKRTLIGRLDGTSLNIESNVGVEVYARKDAK